VELREAVMIYSELTPDEIDVFNLLAEHAGQVASRLLAERGIERFEQVTAEAGRRVLHQAWQEVAESYFADKDAVNLQAAIPEFVEAMIGCCATVGTPGQTLH
jgi:acyl-CoA synthetase (AMP-forming)/AMP-acid ligase II